MLIPSSTRSAQSTNYTQKRGPPSSDYPDQVNKESKLEVIRLIEVPLTRHYLIDSDPVETPSPAYVV